MPSNFQKLNAYRLSVALGRDIYRSVAGWGGLDQRTCGEQLIRAVDSVGANIAESAGRWHPGEKRQLFIIARGSLYETEHWLELALDRRLLEVDIGRVDEIARALSGLIKRPTPLPTADSRPQTEK
jgi:four helix bundle protein